MRLRCIRDAPQRKKGEDIQDGAWPSVALGSPPKTANPTVPRPLTSSYVVHDVLSGGTGTNTTNQAEGEISHQPDLLPWGAFLPVEEKGRSSSGRRRSQVGGFNESLDEEGKEARLEKEEKEKEDGQMREHAEAVGHVGGGALDDLLADLHEPSFSRQENERLRRVIATRLRAKVARLFGRVMCQYFSGSEPNRRSEEDGLAVATAEFRVKLNRLLAQFRLGELQAQVTREISGMTNVPTTRVRRECCTNIANSKASKANERVSRGALKTKFRSTSTIARLHTAAARLAIKSPRKASAGIPAIDNMNAGSPQKGAMWDPSPHASGHILRRASAGVGVGVEDGSDSCMSSSCSNADAIEHKRTSHENSDAVALGINRLLSKGGLCDSRDGMSKGGSPTDGMHCSGEEGVEINDEMTGEVSEQTSPGWSSSDSDDWLFAEESAEPQWPDELCGDKKKGETRDNDGALPRVTPAEQRYQALPQTLPKSGAPKRRLRHRGPSKKCRDARRNGADETGAADSVTRDESWSNRALTVLFKELGLHQSCQRAVLSKHMPATFKGGKDGQLPPEPLPLPRIDRPHFRPTFVELTAAGKGSTLIMCPEPVAPGYEYSDVFEEVVKLHPPVGQLILEDIEKRKIVTRGDAIAHVENLERGSVANQAKVLLDEFLADDGVKDFLASAETFKLDLAQCVMEGTLFDQDDVP